MSTRKVVEALTISTAQLLAEREPGAYVDLDDHPGGRATEADLAARDRMKNEAKRLRPGAMFVSEDSNRPSSIAYPDPSSTAEVLLADPCDGSRQFGQLGFGYASCVSLHTYAPGDWWQLNAASITVSGKTASYDASNGWLVGVGGNTDDSVDLRQYTTRAKVRIPPCIAIGASSASGIRLLPDLVTVRDPEVELDSQDQDPHLRIWNTGGNPITPGLLRSHTMVAVQLSWSTQWDTLFAFCASTQLLGVYPLATMRGGVPPVEADGRPRSLDDVGREWWWGRPRWAPFERKCIPPLVVGPDEPYTHEVVRILQSSDFVQRVRPTHEEAERSRFETAMAKDLDDLLAARRGRLQRREAQPWR